MGKREDVFSKAMDLVEGLTASEVTDLADDLYIYAEGLEEEE